MEEFKVKLKEAERIIKGMDEVESKNGFPTPIQIGTKEVVSTCIIAIEGGLKSNDETSIYEALVMLKELKTKL